MKLGKWMDSKVGNFESYFVPQTLILVSVVT